MLRVGNTSRATICTAPNSRNNKIVAPSPCPADMAQNWAGVIGIDRRCNDPFHGGRGERGSCCLDDRPGSSLQFILPAGAALIIGRTVVHTTGGWPLIAA